MKHDEDRSVMVDLMQEDTRANRKAAKDDSTENANLSIGFCVFKVSETCTVHHRDCTSEHACRL